MDLSRQLKTAIKTGDLTFGQNQASNACANGQAKMLIFAAIFRPLAILFVGFLLLRMGKRVQQ